MTSLVIQYLRRSTLCFLMINNWDKSLTCAPRLVKISSLRPEMDITRHVTRGTWTDNIQTSSAERCWQILTAWGDRNLPSLERRRMRWRDLRLSIVMMILSAVSNDVPLNWYFVSKLSSWALYTPKPEPHKSWNSSKIRINPSRWTKQKTISLRDFTSMDGQTVQTF